MHENMAWLDNAIELGATYVENQLDVAYVENLLVSQKFWCMGLLLYFFLLEVDQYCKAHNIIHK